ncbi:hypothetical protein PPERSA_10318 [Pseudocohnilembus persalinus]|uniref:Uncharacterized protein n=1 Tax=Pseudocohnilembus persalinus TaxID=266149 RepID=A0A0V0R0W9_PSEPJ|nr:hypothetical protein PPERSA_10318 [Pseudocohnilembus persalinus]|eukprot:KRX07930.1 hypothetical protein PPERSA_10318 [Pseudocohnilembus persalinus]
MDDNLSKNLKNKKKFSSNLHFNENKNKMEPLVKEDDLIIDISYIENSVHPLKDKTYNDLNNQQNSLKKKQHFDLPSSKSSAFSEIEVADSEMVIKETPKNLQQGQLTVKNKQKTYNNTSSYQLNQKNEQKLNQESFQYLNYYPEQYKKMKQILQNFNSKPARAYLKMINNDNNNQTKKYNVNINKYKRQLSKYKKWTLFHDSKNKFLEIMKEKIILDFTKKDILQ